LPDSLHFSVQAWLWIEPKVAAGWLVLFVKLCFLVIVFFVLIELIKFVVVTSPPTVERRTVHEEVLVAQRPIRWAFLVDFSERPYVITLIMAFVFVVVRVLVPKRPHRGFLPPR
jgi:hypothetical protein